MPLIHITTSAAHPAPDACDALLAELSHVLSKQFEKPEQWVMTALAPQTRMTFGGSPAPACYVEVKNIGTLEAARAESLSALICRQLSSAFGVDPARIYIEFTDAIAQLWGWNGTTFG